MIANVIERKHYYWIDALRFLAAFVVLLNHSRGVFFCEYDDFEGRGGFLFYSLTRMGHEAVLIFFVLSGYLVGGTAIKRIHERTFDVKNYAINRVARIFLPLISAIILYIIVNSISGNAVNYLVCLGNLFSLQGILVTPLVGPFWSLSYEVWFYILMGIYGILLIKRSFFSLFLVAICFGVFTVLQPIYLFIWILGAFAFLCQPEKGNKWLFIVSALMMALMIVLYQFNRDAHNISMSIPTISIYVIELCFSFFACLFIQQIVLIVPTKRLAIWLERCGSKFAKFSYTLYLVHQTICLFLFKYWIITPFTSLSFKNMSLYLFLLLIVLLLSSLIYYFFERRTNIVKKILKRRF